MSRKLSNAKYAALISAFATQQADARHGMLTPKRYSELAARFQWKQATAHKLTTDAARLPDTAPPITGKCINPTTNEPVTARGDNLVMPVQGSIRPLTDGVRDSGTCPLCGAHVPLSQSKGAIGSHTVRAQPVGASKTLRESRMDVTDTGSRTGAPEASHKHRLTEIDGAYERGTVQIPVPGKNGRTKLEDAEPTEDNVRAALDYWKARKPRKPEAIKAQTTMVSTLTRRLEAIRKGTTGLHAPTAGAAIGARDHGRTNGSALIKGHPLTPMAGPVTVRHISDPTPQHPTITDGVDTREGFKASAGTMYDTAEGTVRPDPEAVTIPTTPANRKPLTRTQRRNATRRRKAAELKAENARLHAQLAATQH